MRPSSSAPSSTTDPPTSTTTADATHNAEAQARLTRLLPAGYPSDSCKPVAVTKDVLAEVNCEKNSDPGGPQSATYTLVRDKGALKAVFER